MDHVNLNTPSRNCLTGADNTPADYKVPFALADFCFLGTMIFANFNQVIVAPCIALSGAVLVFSHSGIAVFIFFLLDIEVEQPEKKKTLREEFSWVDVLRKKQRVYY